MGQPAIVTVKSFTYRDEDEEFSNKWHLSGMPDTQSGFDVLVSTWADLEKAVYSNRVTIVRAYGYADDDDNATWVRDLADASDARAGTYPAFTHGSIQMPGDAAATVRWFTGRTSTTGKRIYLRKYFHDVYRENAGDIDKVDPLQVAAYNEFASSLQDGVETLTPVGPDGEPPVTDAWRVDPFITTRTLKRRGRRPPT